MSDQSHSAPAGAPVAAPAPRPVASDFRAKLRACVAEELDAHWQRLDGGDCRNLRALVLEAAEEELLDFAMRRANGNQRAAAHLLGVSRATLSRKLNGAHAHLMPPSHPSHPTPSAPPVHRPGGARSPHSSRAARDDHSVRAVRRAPRRSS